MLTKTLSALILVVVVLVSACVTQPVQESSMEENELDDFAKCIKESGLKIVKEKNIGFKDIFKEIEVQK